MDLHATWRRIFVSAIVLSAAAAILFSDIAIDILSLPLGLHDPPATWAHMTGDEHSGVVVNLASLMLCGRSRANWSPNFRVRRPQLGFCSRFYPYAQYSRQGRQHTLESSRRRNTRQHAKQTTGALAREPMGHVEVLHSAAEFDEHLHQSPDLVLLAFTTSWCGPCKLFTPMYDRMAEDYNGKASFVKVDAQENLATRQLAKRFQVKTIPSFYLIRDGEIVAKESGGKSEAKLRSTLNEYVEGYVDMLHSREEFEKYVQHSPGLAMLVFTTSWCGACEQVMPMYKRVAADYHGKVNFFKVDAKENEAMEQLANQFQVKTIPAFYLIRDGEVVAKETGLNAEAKLRSTLNEHVKGHAEVLQTWVR